MLWLLRLSLVLHATPAELEGRLTAADLSLYQALVEIDGPWWGEREAAMLRQLCSVQAAAAGSNIPPDQFAIEWTIGQGDDAAAANLLPPADGLAAFAAHHGLHVSEVPQ
ncbi:unnamed protein product [Gemmataceae bacterium]|nr:unnamed protein product [Gemmataceae bacterium]VTU02774.1 unnamed protein product [Gemmataceae bacterium]